MPWWTKSPERAALRQAGGTPMDSRYELYHRTRPAAAAGVSLPVACCIASNLVMGSGFLSLPYFRRADI